MISPTLQEIRWKQESQASCEGGTHSLLLTLHAPLRPAVPSDYFPFIPIQDPFLAFFPTILTLAKISSFEGLCTN